METELVPVSQGEPQDSDANAVDATVVAAAPLAMPGHVYTAEWLEEMMGIGPRPATVAEDDQWQGRRMRLFRDWCRAMNERPPHVHLTYVERRGVRGYQVVDWTASRRVAHAEVARTYNRAVADQTRILGNAQAGVPLEEITARRNLSNAWRGLAFRLEKARPAPPQLPSTRRKADAR